MTSQESLRRRCFEFATNYVPFMSERSFNEFINRLEAFVKDEIEKAKANADYPNRQA